MKHTCPRHLPCRTCNRYCGCRCDGCRAARIQKDRAAKTGEALPSATIWRPGQEPKPVQRRPVRLHQETINMLDDVEWLLDAATPWGEIARRVGRTVGSIEQAARRGGRRRIVTSASAEQRHAKEWQR